jgi:hypothetical protein
LRPATVVTTQTFNNGTTQVQYATVKITSTGEEIANVVCASPAPGLFLAAGTPVMLIRSGTYCIALALGYYVGD